MNMTSISKKFAGVKNEHRTAFLPFVVAGDPDFTTSLAVLKRLAEHADLLEIGFPYSDPLADGAVIQAADGRALASGMNTDKVFDLISQIRTFSNIPITVLVYANLVYQKGIDAFYRKAKKAGIDGVLLPDVPVEESKPFVSAAEKYGIDPIFLVAQTTTNDRLKNILKYATGYLYLVSVLGVTGSVRYFLRTQQFLLSEFVQQPNSARCRLRYFHSRASECLQRRARTALLSGVPSCHHRETRR